MTRRITLAASTRVWADGRLIAGGAPWRLSALGGGLAELVRRLSERKEGLEVDGSDERFGDILIQRGLANPEPHPVRTCTPSDVCLVIPVHNDPEGVRACLASLPHLDAIVVDDASSDPESLFEAVAQCRQNAHANITLIRLDVNVGPGEARNRGIAACRKPLVLLMDADCTAVPGWPADVLHHFDDPRVDAVAPRIVPGNGSFNAGESIAAPLDMGTQEGWVRPGSRIPFVPTAALLARRECLAKHGFDPALRVGEDVDVIWRIHDAGGSVRFDPRCTVVHRKRGSTWLWLRRMHQYGTSAAVLSERHPDRLFAADVSFGNLLSIAAAAAGHLGVGLAVQGFTAARLHGSLQRRGAPWETSAYLVRSGLVSDSRSLGSALRREWWPVGLLALAAAPRSGAGRLLTGLMLGPLLQDYTSSPRDKGVVSYVIARYLGDIAYGTGVMSSVIRHRTAHPLLPRVRRPRVTGRQPATPVPPRGIVPSAQR